MNNELKINTKLQSLMPPLSTEEYQLLEASILEEGCRDPLVVWWDCDSEPSQIYCKYCRKDVKWDILDGDKYQCAECGYGLGYLEYTIVDGHNRYKICQEHNIDFEVTLSDMLPDLNEVKLWIIDNQKGRRNLTDGWKYELSLIKKKILAKRGREKMSEGGKGGVQIQPEGLSVIDKPSDIDDSTQQEVMPIIGKSSESHNTQKIIAQELGWSVGKVAIADVVWKKAPQESIDKIKSGEKTFNEVYKDVQKVEKKATVAAKEAEYKEELKLVDDFDIDIYNTDKKFNIIYADPAWKYWDGGEKNQSLHYQTMTISDIQSLPVGRISADDCILFIWVTHPILPDALKVIESWGFKYSTCGFVWVKKNKLSDSWFFGNGAWTRANSELCLIATKGSITRMSASISQILDDRIMEHSQKPTRVRKLITELVGELPRIELFSRNNTNDGWFNWGDGV